MTVVTSAIQSAMPLFILTLLAVAESAGTCSIRAGANCASADLNVSADFGVAAVSDCCNACQANPLCKAFTVDSRKAELGKSVGSCYLKAACIWPVPDELSTAGMADGGSFPNQTFSHCERATFPMMCAAFDTPGNCHWCGSATAGSCYHNQTACPPSPPSAPSPPSPSPPTPPGPHATFTVAVNPHCERATFPMMCAAFDTPGDCHWCGSDTAGACYSNQTACPPSPPSPPSPPCPSPPAPPGPHATYVVADQSYFCPLHYFPIHSMDDCKAAGAAIPGIGAWKVVAGETDDADPPGCWAYGTTGDYGYIYLNSGGSTDQKQYRAQRSAICKGNSTQSGIVV